MKSVTVVGVTVDVGPFGWVTELLDRRTKHLCLFIQLLYSGRTS